MAHYRKDSAVWKEPTPSRKHSGVWKEVQERFRKHSGAWKSAYQNALDWSVFGGWGPGFNLWGGYWYDYEAYAGDQDSTSSNYSDTNYDSIPYTTTLTIINKQRSDGTGTFAGIWFRANSGSLDNDKGANVDEEVTSDTVSVVAGEIWIPGIDGYGDAPDDPNQRVYFDVVDGDNTLVDSTSCQTDYYGCFAAGTSILMADGSTKPIEAVQEGDWVLNLDSETGDLKPDRVCWSWPERKSKGNLYRMTFANGSVLTVTGQHPFYISPYETATVEQLQVGATVLCRSGNTVGSTTLVEKDGVEDTTVYNFRVNDRHLYFADGILVGNK